METFKGEQQKELEAYKTQQQKELEHLRHLLSSRISKIHEKEFEVLPQAWLLLQELHGTVARTIGTTFQYFPNFIEFSSEKLDAFLRDELASKRLSDYQAEELRQLQSAEKQQKYYTKAIDAYLINKANESKRLFINCYLQNRIFMNDELREVFTQAQGALTRALSDYEIGTAAQNHNMVTDSQRTLLGVQLQLQLDNVDRAIQKRLRYAEAD